MRYFLEVAKSEHVTNSAKKLNIAQPALTQSIHRLERELGVPLFERQGRNIRLTAAGTYLRDRIAPAVESFETLADDVRAFAAEKQRTVRVGIFSASNVAVDAVAAYTAGHAASFQITQDAFDTTCDITVSTVMPTHLAARPPIATAADCVILHERIGVAVPQARAFGETVSLAELADERFICLAGSRRFREICDALCERRSFFPRIGFESDSPAVVRKMIGLGMGVGFWPTCSWDKLEGAGARLARLEETEFERSIALTRTSHVQPGSEAAAFYDFLVGFFQQRWNERVADGAS